MLQSSYRGISCGEIRSEVISDIVRHSTLKERNTVMAKKYIVTDKQLKGIQDQFDEIKRQLTHPEGSLINPQYTVKALQYAIEHNFTAHVRDKNFKLIDSFEFIMPEDFDAKKELEMWDDSWKEYFKNSSYNPKPGEELEIKMFLTKNIRTRQQCYDFLKLEEALLVGAPVLSLVHREGPDRFDLKEGATYISFHAWWSLKGEYPAPFKVRYSPALFGGEETPHWAGYGGMYSDHIHQGAIIVCFCKKQTLKNK